jgi:hypothetical protein
MKCYSLVLVFFFYSISLFAQPNQIIKALNPQKCPNIKIKVPNNLIKHEAWDKGGIRVDILILSAIPDTILKALLEAGRYELEGKKEEESFYVTAPNLEIPMTLNGATFKEEISIKISTPQYFVMNDNEDLYKDINEEIVRSRSETPEQFQAILKKMKAIGEDINVHLKVVSNSKVKGVDFSSFIFNVNGKKYTADKIVF